MKYNNHLNVGAQTFNHKDKKVVSSINSPQFQIFIDNFKNYEFDVGIIPIGYEHRADLISNLFYNTPTLDWLICLINEVSDPFQQLNVGDTIKIPKLL